MILCPLGPVCSLQPIDLHRFHLPQSVSIELRSSIPLILAILMLENVAIQLYS